VEEAGCHRLAVRGIAALALSAPPELHPTLVALPATFGAVRTIAVASLRESPFALAAIVDTLLGADRDLALQVAFSLGSENNPRIDAAVDTLLGRLLDEGAPIPTGIWQGGAMRRQVPERLLAILRYLEREESDLTLTAMARLLNEAMPIRSCGSAPPMEVIGRLEAAARRTTSREARRELLRTARSLRGLPLAPLFVMGAATGTASGGEPACMNLSFPEEALRYAHPGLPMRRLVGPSETIPSPD
jgi:hypothetical protein